MTRAWSILVRLEEMRQVDVKRFRNGLRLQYLYQPTIHRCSPFNLITNYILENILTACGLASNSCVHALLGWVCKNQYV